MINFISQLLQLLSWALPKFIAIFARLFHPYHHLITEQAKYDTHARFTPAPQLRKFKFPKSSVG